MLVNPLAGSSLLWLENPPPLFFEFGYKTGCERLLYIFCCEVGNDSHGG